ncbi:MAG: ATP-dependent Clp protease ATP-binding subunit ClpX [bacterium]|nr:ATP-dependent Clp protease ATP-binding subunit ClpX [bacterium]
MNTNYPPHTKATNPEKCSFCGRTVSQTKILVAGPNVSICDQCIKAASEIVRRASSTKHPKLDHLPKPTEIKQELDQYVVGQEDAKKRLAVAVYNHYKRIKYPSVENSVEIEKSNVLLLGPTGTGKTLLAQTLARFLQVPFAIADATTLTEAGYVGEDVENVLVRLYQAADYDVSLTEMGIVYIDEIDKISRKQESPSITRDVSGEGVQQALLKLLEGTVAGIPPEGGRKHPEQKLVYINTKKILFICGGAFEGIDKIIADRLGKSSIGFGAEIRTKRDLSVTELLSQIQPLDLIRYGLIPELVGRLPVVTALSELSPEVLRKILIEPRNALIKQYQELFALDGIRLVFEEGAIQAIVELAAQKRTGARALRSILENVMTEWMYRLPSENDLIQITITRETVLHQAEPILLRRSEVAA